MWECLEDETQFLAPPPPAWGGSSVAERRVYRSGRAGPSLGPGAHSRVTPAKGLPSLEPQFSLLSIDDSEFHVRVARGVK